MQCLLPLALEIFHLEAPDVLVELEPDRARPAGVLVRQFLPNLTFAGAALYLGKAPTDGLAATFLHSVRRAVDCLP